MRLPEPRDVEVVFEGLGQKTSTRTKAPGRLRTAQNVVFDKSGELNKRRGYTRVDMDDGTDEVLNNALEGLFLNVGTFRDRLFVYGAEFLYDVASLSGSLDGTAFVVRRGPVLRGQYSVQHVVSSSSGTEVAHGTGL